MQITIRRTVKVIRAHLRGVGSLHSSCRAFECRQHARARSRTPSSGPRTSGYPLLFLASSSPTSPAPLSSTPAESTFFYPSLLAVSSAARYSHTLPQHAHVAGTLFHALTPRDTAQSLTKVFWCFDAAHTCSPLLRRSSLVAEALRKRRGRRAESQPVSLSDLLFPSL